MKKARIFPLLDVLGFISLIFMISCGPRPDEVADIVSPVSTAITNNSASLGATVTDDSDGEDVSERGVVYSRTATNSKPSIEGIGVTKVTAAGSVGSFLVNVGGLAPGTEYSFAAYATNPAGTSYTTSASFTTRTDAGAVAGSFAPQVSGIDHAFINATAVQPDGKILIGGSFETVGGHFHRNIARLHPDGSVDTNFSCRVDGDAYASVYAIAVQPDGKILIAGSFRKVNGVARDCIARLNSDGSVESTRTFNPGKGADFAIQDVLVQPDGQIVIAGYFEHFNRQARGHIARLHPDGSLEDQSTFAASTDSRIASIALQDDGQILVAGAFDEVNGVIRRNLVRLNPDGSLESTATFDTGTGPDFPVTSVAVQEDGQILIGGPFAQVNGVARNGIARLNPDGSVESSATFDPGTGIGGGLYPNVSSIATQADGKILIAGSFETVNGQPRVGLARLNPDGSLEDAATFDIGSGAFSAFGPGGVVTVAVQPDGRLLVGGGFGSFNDQPTPFLALLENDQATQSLYAPDPSEIRWERGGAAPALNGVTFELSTDGGISWSNLGSGTYAAGAWELTGLGLPPEGLIRARGKVTAGYANSGTGLVQQISPIAGGPAVVMNPTSANVLDGTADLGGEVVSDGGTPVFERGVVYSLTSENPSPAIDDDNVTVDLDTGDGLGVFVVPVAGLELGAEYTFRAFATNDHGTTYSPVASFTTLGPPVVDNLQVLSVSTTSATVGGEVMANGGAVITERGIVYYAGGNSGGDRLATQNGVTKIPTLSEDGTPGEFSVNLLFLEEGTEYTFAAYATNVLGTGYSETWTFTTGVAAQPDDSGQPSAAAALDVTFAPAINGSFVQATAVEPGGTIIIGGIFDAVGGQSRGSLARLNADGSLDPNFNAGTNGAVFGIAVQTDGKIVIGGAFTVVNGVPRNGIARLHGDGTLDEVFAPGAGANGIVYALAIQPDGGILLGGLFDSVNGEARKNIARLNSDGTLESIGTFNPGTGADDAIYSIAIQPDGRILLGGAFQNVDGTASSRIARLNPNGTVENSATFNPGTGADDRVFVVLAQADGKILVGGDFSAINGEARAGVARLNADGSVEALESFDPGAGADGSVVSMTLQADGRILLAGAFENVNGTPRNRIARLNPDGTLDPTGAFDPGTGANAEVASVAVLGNGQVVAAGGFTTFDGAANNLIVRLNNDAVTQDLTITDGSDLQWLRSGAAPEVRSVVFEVSSNSGRTWTRLGAGTRIDGGWELSGQSLPARGILRALGQTVGGYLSSSSGWIEQRLQFPTTVPVKNGPVTDGDGATYAALGTPQTGAFAGSAKVGTKKIPAIFTTDGSVLLQVGSDDVSKIGTLNGNAVLVTLKTGGAVTAKNNVQLLVGVKAGALVVGAQTGTAYPGLPAGVTIKKFIAIDGGGTTTFALANLQGTGVTGKNNLALVAIAGPGDVKIVARKDQEVTIDSKTQKVTTLATLVGSKGTLAAQRWRVDDTRFGVRVSFPDKLQAAFVVPATANSSADWTLLSRTGALGDSITGLNGATVSSYGLPGFGSSNVAQVVNLAKGTGDVTPKTNAAIISGNNVSGFKLLARKDYDARDADGDIMIGIFYKTLADPISGPNGSVAFAGTLAGSGVTAKNKSGIWFARDGVTAKLLARAGDSAPGGGKWKDFSSLVLPDDSARGPIFLGKLAVSAADQVTAKNSLRLWAMDTTGQLRLIFRAGQSARVNGVDKEVKTFTALVPTAGAIGAASGYDSDGNVAVLATFTDRTQAVLVLPIP